MMVVGRFTPYGICLYLNEMGVKDLTLCNYQIVPANSESKTITVDSDSETDSVPEIFEEGVPDDYLEDE